MAGAGCRLAPRLPASCDRTAEATFGALKSPPFPAGVPTELRVNTAIRISLRTKFVRSMVALLSGLGAGTLVVVAMMDYFSSRAALTTLEARLRENILRQGSELVTSQALALRDMVADNAFGDVARLVERTTAQNDQLLYGLFLDPDLKAWAYQWRGGSEASGQAARSPAWEDLGVDVMALRHPGVKITQKNLAGQSIVEFAVAVNDDREAFLGSLRYGVSDSGLEQDLAEARRAFRRSFMGAVLLLALIGVITLVIGVVLSRRAASRITHPVAALTAAANALAAGRRDIRVSIDSGDELAMLGSAFNNMAAELQDQNARLEELNRALEEKVAARTEELAERNRDMRLVLDNVDQGFLTVSTAGILADERSRIVDTWFGAYAPGTRFADYIGRVDAGFAEAFALGFQALLDGFLPLDLCLHQMPSRIRAAGREYECTYFPLGRQEATSEGLLIVIDDVTSRLMQARRDAERTEILALFEALMKDRTGLLSFIDETGKQMLQVRTRDLKQQKQIVHTLKGNCHVMGLGVLAALCEKLEEEIAETGLPASDTSVAKVDRRWVELTQALRSFIGSGRDVLEIAVPEVDNLLREIRAGAPVGVVQDRLASWKLEPVERSLSRLGTYASSLAKRFGKGDPIVVVEGNGLRLAPTAWAGLWSELVHVIRNAVDHGFESTAIREQCGKPVRPRLRLVARGERNKLVVEIEDDGAGIDWSAVRQAAVRLGLPHATEADLVEALFAADVSTRGELTALSGRGVGLAAVRSQVAARGGTVEVESQRGVGACFRFSFPLATSDAHSEAAEAEATPAPSATVLG